MPSHCPHCQGRLPDESPFVVVDAKAPRQARPAKMPAKPWFYSVMAVVAYAWALGGTLVFLFACWGSQGAEDRFGIIAGSLVFMVSTWILAAPMLVLLDTARNVRALRYRR